MFLVVLRIVLGRFCPVFGVFLESTVRENSYVFSYVFSCAFALVYGLVYGLVYEPGGALMSVDLPPYYALDVIAMRADLRIVLNTYPATEVEGCPLCGSHSVAHHCPPKVKAKDRLMRFANLDVDPPS